MVVFFPELYPDELMYSVICRFYVKSGLPAYKYVADTLFISKNERPSMEFINTCNPDALKVMPPRDLLINKHTLFPCYARFLPEKKREQAFDMMMNGNKEYINVLPTTQNTRRFLKYCPLCIKHDREVYGEAYWHRTHQLPDISVCPEHHCCLVDSDILISGKTPLALTPAESIDCVEPEPAGTVAVALAEYMEKVFTAEEYSSVPFGLFLYSRLDNTEYSSIRGKYRDIKKLLDDINCLFPEIEHWQIKALLCNNYYNFSVICKLALFLNIPPDDLVVMPLPEKSKQELFDEEVKRLHIDENLSYSKIAERLNVSYSTVKYLGMGHKNTYHRKPRKVKHKKKPFDWGKKDAETLPVIKELIHHQQGRPRRITTNFIERYFNFGNSTVKRNLPLCYEEIMKNLDPIEKHWAKEIIWAVGEIGEPLHWRTLCHLINIDRKALNAALPYINDNKTIQSLKTAGII